ncbi:amidohydrolase family protein [Streptosporangium roseum]|uniref:Amidohydrolase family protein n=1 Tax=Streptosporangium roseum (strain ATCC 12428 / DSM 43021 / JCM 3005 / KCTC 9067 / NCIMB 10171 / NRRL 2505 / NI 9100) TaxID=479432 RepID=D2B0D8_STRRD|nr:amidohydrolase family protein [Streptosporangium roseum]ACZ89144.1 amidohydrolase family protein [Streptosporangium roseum DSM 43021]
MQSIIPEPADADVPAWWRGLGLPGLADVHVHFLPERMERRVWHHFENGGPLMGAGWPIHYRVPAEERVARLGDLGVRAFSALAYAHRPGMAADLNAWTLDFARRTPGCLPSATFYPEPGVLDYVRDALDRGARIFKVHLQVGDFDPRLREIDEVWGLLAERGVPVVVHASSIPLPGRCTGPVPIAGVLARHPRLAVVVAHLGMPEYEEFFRMAETFANVRLDTTMTFTDFAERGMPFPAHLGPRLRDLGLAGKVLLGSDFPNIPYPYAHQIHALDRLGLGEDWLRAVCWDSAADLFDLSPDYTRSSGER